MNDKTVTTARPTVTLKGGEHRRVVAGHPWVFSNEVIMDNRAKSLAPGSVVTVGGMAVAKLRSPANVTPKLFEPTAR